MLKKKIIHKALKSAWDWGINPCKSTLNLCNGQDKEVSILIFNLYGGEILKTPTKKSWHFYNRINGERLDFSIPKVGKVIKGKGFKDIPSTPDEASQYIDQSDFHCFYMRFIKAFEEILGLKKLKVA
jgi:hypothetical protein